MSFKKFTSKWGNYAPSCSVRNLPLKFMLFFLDAKDIFEKNSFQLSVKSKQLSTLVTNLVKLNEKLGLIEVITHTQRKKNNNMFKVTSANNERVSPFIISRIKL